jgi:hypothetical protein
MDCKDGGEALLIILAVVVILLILLGFFIGTPPAPGPVPHSLAIAHHHRHSQSHEPRTNAPPGVGLAIMVGVKMVKRRMDVIHNKYASPCLLYTTHRLAQVLLTSPFVFPPPPPPPQQI